MDLERSDCKIKNAPHECHSRNHSYSEVHVAAGYAFCNELLSVPGKWFGSQDFASVVETRLYMEFCVLVRRCCTRNFEFQLRTGGTDEDPHRRRMCVRINRAPTQ